MNAKATRQTAEAPAPAPLPTDALPTPAGPASLAPFPAPLQRRIAEGVLETTPARATDIWYEDKASSQAHVIRSGVQWHLNPTASAIWQLLDGQRAARAIADELAAKHAGQDHEAIRVAVVEFLLHASSYGLVELYPEPPPAPATP